MNCWNSVKNFPDYYFNNFQIFLFLLPNFLNLNFPQLRNNTTGQEVLRTVMNMKRRECVAQQSKSSEASRTPWGKNLMI